ncbi:MAG: hypothetical protein EBZ36_13770, partial [Acidobacteria bacterium]|nr:hypothetical protein [Acidobacteriota bacterium]
ALTDDVGEEDGDHRVRHTGHNDNAGPLLLWALLLGRTHLFRAGAGFRLIDALDGGLVLGPLLTATGLCGASRWQEGDQQQQDGHLPGGSHRISFPKMDIQTMDSQTI